MPDFVHVLSDGKIIESGTHQDLLKKNGQYRKLFELQFRDEKVEV